MQNRESKSESSLLHSASSMADDTSTEIHDCILNLMCGIKEVYKQILRMLKMKVTARSEEEMEKIKTAIELFHSDQVLIRKKLSELKFQYGERESDKDLVNLDLRVSTYLEILEQKLYGLMMPEIGNGDNEIGTSVDSKNKPVNPSGSGIQTNSERMLDWIAVAAERSSSPEDLQEDFPDPMNNSIESSIYTNIEGLAENLYKISKEK